MAKKKKRIIPLILLAAVIGAGVFFYYNGNALIVRATERIASNAIGVPVNIGSLHLSWKEKMVTVDTLEVGNPPGYKSPHAVTADKILIGLNTASKQLIDFKNIEVKGSEIYFEMTPTGTNLTDLKKLATSSEQKEKAGNETIRVIVQNMVIGASTIHPRISLLNRDIEPIKMPALKISGIGQKKTGSNAGEVIVQVLTRYITAAQSSVAQSGVLNQLPANLNMDGAKKSIEGARGKLKNLF